MASFDYSGKTILVVGGSSGIGRAIAHGFLDAGADVHIWGTRADASLYEDEHGRGLDGLRYAQMDAADFEGVAGYVPPFDKLDILVLSQGVALYGRREFQTENFRKVVDVNLNSLMACAEKFKDMLAARGGSLIIISSTAAFHSTFGNPAYNASKTGAFGLTRTLGHAWARTGIRVNGIAPGFVETKMTEVTTADADRKKRTEADIPLGRLGVPIEIAGVALFLASPLASYVIGQTIAVDGGYSL